MKRIQYHRYGGPEVMRFEDFEPARPRAGEVLVRVRAAAVNPYDWKIRNGEMKMMTGRKGLQGCDPNRGDRGSLREGKPGWGNLSCMALTRQLPPTMVAPRAEAIWTAARPTPPRQARDLGIDPVAEFDRIPGTMKGRFDIVPTAAKFAKSVMPGPYKVMFAQHNASDLDELAHACAHGTLRLPIAQTVPLGQAIAALTELERNNTPRGGKLIITAS
jgi:NADPH:quinone reductase-like Zn-dependent oxidoreductase